jgi:O-antigen/teichoic acid export membrane protein
VTSSAEIGLPAPTVPAAETARRDDLRHKVISGFRWKLVSQLSGQGARIVVGLVFARLLTPHEFGLAAMALTFSGLALVFADPALGAALVQRRKITENDRSTVFWTTVATGAVCTVAGIALAGPIASFFGEPRVRWLVVVESFSFVIVALSATQAAVMTRAMAFRGLELRDVGGTLAGCALGIALAFAGFGPWAIIAQSIAMVSVSTVLIWRFSTWRPRFTYSLDSLRDCGSFGIKLFGSRVMAFVNTYADNMLVGRFLGSGALGLYSLAYNVMFNPISRLITPIQAVLVPAFSRMQEDRARLGQAWLRGSRVVALASFPAFAGMIAVAPDFVPVVLGHRWTQAVPVVQLLCLAGAGQAVQTLQHSVLQARGEAGTLLRFMIVSSVMNVTAFAFGLQWGIVGVAACFVVSRALLLPVLTWRTTREVGLKSVDLVRSLSAPIQASLTMALAVFGARFLLSDAGLSAGLRLPILVLVGIAVYGAFCLLWARDVVGELRLLARDRNV